MGGRRIPANGNLGPPRLPSSSSFFLRKATRRRQRDTHTPRPDSLSPTRLKSRRMLCRKNLDVAAQADGSATFSISPIQSFCYPSPESIPRRSVMRNPQHVWGSKPRENPPSESRDQVGPLPWGLGGGGRVVKWAPSTMPKLMRCGPLNSRSRSLHLTLFL